MSGKGCAWRSENRCSPLKYSMASAPSLTTSICILREFRRALSDPSVEAERLAIAEQAKKRGVFGVTYFLVGDRAFFGNDRLTLPRDVSRASGGQTRAFAGSGQAFFSCIARRNSSLLTARPCPTLFLASTSPPLGS